MSLLIRLGFIKHLFDVGLTDESFASHSYTWEQTIPKVSIYSYSVNRQQHSSFLRREVFLGVRFVLLLHNDAILNQFYSLITKHILIRITVALLTAETSSHFVGDEVFATPLTFLFDWYFTFHSIVFWIYQFLNHFVYDMSRRFRELQRVTFLHHLAHAQSHSFPSRYESGTKIDAKTVTIDFYRE